MRALQSMGSTRIFELGGNEGARQRAAAPCALPRLMQKKIVVIGPSTEVN